MKRLPAFVLLVTGSVATCLAASGPKGAPHVPAPPPDASAASILEFAAAAAGGDAWLYADTNVMSGHAVLCRDADPARCVTADRYVMYRVYPREVKAAHAGTGKFRLDALAKHFGGLKAVGGIDLDVQRGDLAARPDVAVLAFGTPAIDAIKAADQLAADYKVAVYDARFAKPVDHDLIRSLLSRRIPIVTVEDHAVIGGFGAALDEHEDANADQRDHEHDSEDGGAEDGAGCFQVIALHVGDEPDRPKQSDDDPGGNENEPNHATRSPHITCLLLACSPGA